MQERPVRLVVVAEWYVAAGERLAAIGELHADLEGFPGCGETPPTRWVGSWSVEETRATRPEETCHQKLEAVAVGQHAGDRDRLR